MKQLAKICALSGVLACTLGFTAIAKADTNNGQLSIINNLDTTVGVKCPSPIAVPVHAGKTLNLPYGGGSFIKLTVYNAMNRKTTGTCTFSVNGAEVATADITLGSKANLDKLSALPKFSNADVKVTITDPTYTVNGNNSTTEASGNEIAFTVDKK